MNRSNTDNKLSYAIKANNSTPLSVEQFFSNDGGVDKSYFGKKKILNSNDMLSVDGLQGFI